MTQLICNARKQRNGRFGSDMRGAVVRIAVALIATVGPSWAGEPQPAYRSGADETSVTLGPDDLGRANSGGFQRPESSPTRRASEARVDGPILDEQGCVNLADFELTWRKYSDFVSFDSRTAKHLPVQRYEELYDEIANLEEEIDQLEELVLEEIEARRNLRKARGNLVRGIENNLLRAFIRLAWITKQNNIKDLAAQPLERLLFGSADLTPEEIELLRTERLTLENITQVLDESYEFARRRQDEIDRLRQETRRMRAEAESWAQKEKDRVFALLNKDCRQDDQQETTPPTPQPDVDLIDLTEGPPEGPFREKGEFRSGTWTLVGTVTLPYQFANYREEIAFTPEGLHVKSVNEPRYYVHEVEMNWDAPPATLTAGASIPLSIRGSVSELDTSKPREPIGFGREADWLAGTAHWYEERGEWTWGEGQLLPSPRQATAPGCPAVYEFTAPGSGYKFREISGRRTLSVPHQLDWYGNRRHYLFVMLSSRRAGQVAWIYEPADPQPR